MQFLKKLLKRPAPKSQGIVAISFLPTGFAVAITRYSEHNRPKLVFCDFVTGPRQNWLGQLELLVRTHKLEQFACHILLSQEQYRSFSVEAPQVNPDEIKAALSWRISEIIDYPAEQAEIDFYPMPKSNRANRTPMLEVVTCHHDLLSPLLQLCQKARLNVRVVDIQETALRNLATLLPENQQGIAILHIQPSACQIVIQKGGEIYLSRRLDFNYQKLHENLPEGGNDLMPEQNNLALEIQRSFDFVENYYDIPPVTSLAAVLIPHRTEQIVNFLMIDHGITARAMDLSAFVDSDVLLNDALQNICAPVIGASLRRLIESHE